MSDTSISDRSTRQDRSRAGRQKPVTLDLPQQSIRSDRNALLAALIDIWQGLSRADVWTALAWESFVSTYRRASLGILWATLSFIMFVFAILTFRVAVSRGELSDEASYVIFGFLFFQLLSQMILSAVNVFVTAASWLKGTLMPLSLFVFNSISTNTIVFVFNIVGALVVLIYFGYSPTVGAWKVLPAFAVTLFNAIWVYLFLGIVMARYRDAAQFLAAIMRMAIFLTPILWIPVPGTLMAYVAYYNPLTYFIDILRVPLLDGTFPIDSWKTVGGITAAGWVLAILTFAWGRRKVIYWIQ
ncbi:hypothetical protein D1227_04875 [Henriciella mobilis]|uniref:ABC transporter permease n=1 Tax=Henriciella mobilis TaxID=2305467 RepID=UPI000E6709EA|nr:ABC transporter permease [Henriciella mobilis]RIJ17357.1 hypothetical protein D1231_03670 [Henriciella mobilis]RIJ25654.1 hypothetical protein D1227_04875 [Henriciella mobilis]